ncbi:MAG: hypothetical protein JXA06_09015 [Bacteroidetes bacterium]|nr:hypothetical protein [Bacteroidota bacterium]
MQTFITFSLLILIFSVLSYLAKSPPKYIEVEDGILLTYPKTFMIIFVVCCGILPLGLCLGLLLKIGLNSNGEIVGFTIAVILFLSFSILGYLKLTHDKIMATSDGIFADYLFRSTYSFYWKEISKVTYSNYGRQLIFETADKRKLKISILFKGFPILCQLAATKLPQSIYLEELEKAKKGKIFI